MTSFVARTAFPPLTSLPRSYYLGHHAAGLSKMRTLLRQIDLIIECRDQRIPLTSRNPMFEESLAGKERMIVYTKSDLGNTGSRVDLQVWIQAMTVDMDKKRTDGVDRNII
jgi:ribosome biogenesis GTPase A